MSITKRSGQAMPVSSIISDNVHPCIQLRVNTFAKAFGLTTKLEILEKHMISKRAICQGESVHGPNPNESSKTI